MKYCAVCTLTQFMLDLCYIKTFCSSVKFLMLYSCLAALRRSYSDASERDYRSTVMNWLDGSKDCNGGRKRRSESHAVARDDTDSTEKN